MFGHNPLNYGNIHNLLHHAETYTFKADDHFDVEPTDPAKAGQYVKAKWLGDPPHYNWQLTFTDGSNGNGGHDNATGLVKWLQNNDVGPAGHKSRGQGVKFESLPDSDQATADAAPPPASDSDCASENREDGATDDVCGDCLSGFTEDDTGTCVADAEDEEEKSNTMRNLAIGGVIVCVIGIASQLR